MSLIKSLIGRRQFMVAAGLASTSALAFKKVAGLVDPIFKTNIAGAAEKSASGTKGSYSLSTTNERKLGDLRCVIIYYSLTGNTEKIARGIQKGVVQAAGNCDMIPFKEANPYKLEEYDLIGFGHPIMGGLLSWNEHNWLKELRYVGGKHVFLFSTSHSGGNNFYLLVPLFKEQGVTTIGMKAWKGCEYNPLGEPCPTAADGHPDKIDLEEAEAFGKQMVENSRLIYAGNTSLIPPEPKGSAKGIIEWDAETAWEKMKWRLLFDKSKCLYPKCRLCMDICPVHGIDLTVDPPRLADPCLPCNMCDQVCPTGAATIDPIHFRWQNANHDYEKTGRQRLAQLKEGIKVEEHQIPSSPYGPTNTKQYLTDEEVAEGFLHQVYKVFNKRPRFVVGYGRPYGIDPATLEDRGPAPENWPE